MFWRFFCNPYSMDDLVSRYCSPKRRLVIYSVIWLQLCYLWNSSVCSIVCRERGELSGNSLTYARVGISMHCFCGPDAGDCRLVVTDENAVHVIFYSFSVSIWNVIPHLPRLNLQSVSCGSSCAWLISLPVEGLVYMKLLFSSRLFLLIKQLMNQRWNDFPAFGVTVAFVRIFNINLS